MFQVLVGDDGFEHTELCFAIVELQVELLHHFDDFRHGNVGTRRNRLFRSADRRDIVEIEFAVVDVRHFGQAAAQGIEAYDSRVHLRHAYGQCVQRIFLLLPDRRDGLLL